jgi:uncharacterized membrane protein YkoI
MSKVSGIIPIVFALCSSLAFAAHPPKTRISMEQAQKAATQAQAGTIESKELEHEHGKWVYSFDIRGSDSMIHEVQIDAKNGKIVSQKIETPTQEAAEKKSEKK